MPQLFSHFRGNPLCALIVALTAVAAGAPVAATAQSDWPNRPITYVVPYPPGGTTDIVARLIAQKLGQALHTTVVVENKPGATGAIGSAFVARAAPDGYTLLGASTASHAINPALNPKPTYDAVKSFAPVVLVGTIPSVLVVGANSPYRDVRGLLAAAKREPGKLSYGSGGTGTILQMSAELLQQQQGIRMTHVPYKGDVPAIQDVMAGHVDFMFAPTAPILPLVKGTGSGLSERSNDGRGRCAWLRGRTVAGHFCPRGYPDSGDPETQCRDQPRVERPGGTGSVRRLGDQTGGWCGPGACRFTERRHCEVDARR